MGQIIFNWFFLFKYLGAMWVSSCSKFMCLRSSFCFMLIEILRIHLAILSLFLDLEVLWLVSCMCRNVQVSLSWILKHEYFQLWLLHPKKSFLTYFGFAMRWNFLKLYRRHVNQALPVTQSKFPAALPSSSHHLWMIFRSSSRSMSWRIDTMYIAIGSPCVVPSSNLIPVFFIKSSDGVLYDF